MIFLPLMSICLFIPEANPDRLCTDTFEVDTVLEWNATETRPMDSTPQGSGYLVLGYHETGCRFVELARIAYTGRSYERTTGAVVVVDTDAISGGDGFESPILHTNTRCPL